MIDFFARATQDQSFQYLGFIFGSMNGVLQSATGAGNISILGTMFRVFNSCILVVAGLMLLYVTIVGVVQTAHEGEFMGKKWNNIWIPIRSVMGIALMVPTASGYCVLQIAMMWVIIQGIGAADTLWTTALNYTTVMGSPYSQGAVTTGGSGEALTSLFAGLVCDATAKVKEPNPSLDTSYGYYCGNNQDGFCQSQLTIDNTKTQLSLGPQGGCGSLSYCNATTACANNQNNSLNCLSCTAQIAALQQIVPLLDNIASQVAAADASYRAFTSDSTTNKNQSNSGWIYQYCSAQGISKDQCTGANLPPPNSVDPTGTGHADNTSNQAITDVYWQYWPQLGPSLNSSGNFIQVAKQYYMDAATTAYTTYMAALQQTNPGEDSHITTAKQNGWIQAGGYYYFFTQVNSSNLNQAQPVLKFNGPGSSNGMNGYRNNSGAAAALVSYVVNGGQSVGNADFSAAISGISDIQDSVNSAASLFSNQNQNIYAGNTQYSNPLTNLAVIGASLLIVVQVIFVIIVGVILALAIAGNLSVFVLGSGFVNPVGPAAQLFSWILVPLIYALLGYMVAIGGMLSVYIPLIPYVVFTFGAIGWLISVVEAMVAGPLVALGIISPSGQHELLGKAEPALMLLFNVFLRPSLMIFGLVAAYFLSIVVAKMINDLFFPVVYVGLSYAGKNTVTTGTLTTSQATNGGLIWYAMMLGAYVMLMVAALNKCFSAINVIPQQVMRWISGQGEQVEAPMEQVKGGMEAVGGVARGGMESYGQAAKAGGKESKEAGSEAELKGKSATWEKGKGGQ